MAFDLKNLELFVRVAAIGGIARAGAEFNLSATNASERIKALEADLGVKLLNRTTRSVSLTPDGNTFLAHATSLLEGVEEARLSVSQSARSVSGLLRITASASFGQIHLVPFLAEFLGTYPEINLDLNLTDMNIDIVELGYDLALRIGELSSSSLLAQKIADNPSRLVASPKYLCRAGQPASPADLADHVCFPFGQNRTWRFLDKRSKLHEVQVSGPLKINHGMAVDALVKSGMGIGVAPLWFVGPALRSGELVSLLPDFRVWPETNIWAVRSPGRLKSRRVKAFLDFFQSRIAKTNLERYGDLD